MLEADVIFQEYVGTLASVDLLGGTTLLLNQFGPEQTGTVQDDDGTATPGEPGMMLDGSDMIVVGTGTVQAGVDTGIIIVGIGPQVQVVLVEDSVTGEQYFLFPDGVPSELGMVALILNLDTEPMEMNLDFEPVCFVAGTPILTVDGFRPVETIRPGDQLIDWRGESVGVLWTGAQRITGLAAPGRADLRPLALDPGAFGAAVTEAVRLSGNHRVMVGGPEVGFHFGEDQVLLAAKGLLGTPGAAPVEGQNAVVYHHILCERHTVICAGGLWCETLLLGPVSTDVLKGRALVEIEAAEEDDLTGAALPLRRACLPVLKMREAPLVTRFERLSQGRAIQIAA